mmetsp:Transcript_8873/g.33514  ORF Transcript_8873/g.33514 Transcript_8873/m.33514 type:complete len:81 (-) Transcript_8873:1079-1321(-)
MPRYFCDYCDTYLTHDSAQGRKQHMRGWKHREAVKQYYEPIRAAWEQADRECVSHPCACISCGVSHRFSHATRLCAQVDH